MNSLELNLNKRLFIVESSEIKLGKEGIIYKDKNSHVSDLIEGHFKLICKGSDLTEEIAKGLVEGELQTAHMFGQVVFKLYDYKGVDIKTFGWTNNALQSFISAIESNGWYWEENPFKKELDRCNEYTDMFTIAKRTRNYEESESRTFNPEKCIIFEIV
ncbi:Uncharacterised protein [Chryseobacterium nakagawai]|uniref:Uncharacterized protein n=1 Tax=Chryseobacterium nakagawai TaxID=1241982 RepID=A0AAD0YJU5_CHRNA|nr:hypothetical protein [Chryseobacterium nakagawai]AZA91147.1 hypothetical protein EG343_11150 [Chryseobacterium nakagawai]VEH22707.1 Uncharacterised protein [Chryseobacterium nakagawai]